MARIMTCVGTTPTDFDMRTKPCDTRAQRFFRVLGVWLRVQGLGLRNLPLADLQEEQETTQTGALPRVALVAVPSKPTYEAS